MLKPGVFRSGTSGLVLAERNKTFFPEEYQNKTRLQYYSSKFNSIEINSSFYKIPRAETYRKWSAEVPADFRFSVKLWRGVTHNRELMNSSADMEVFFSALHALDTKAGCLLSQFPATSAVQPENIRDILKQKKKLDPGDLWRVAIEFRHNQWYRESVYDMIYDFGATLVLHDMPASRLGKLTGSPPFIYLRFHGEKGDYRGSYSKDFLNRKAMEIRNWLEDGLDVYAYFNNTIEGAAENLQTLNEMVGKLQRSTSPEP